MGIFKPRYTVRFEHTVIKQTKEGNSLIEERKSFQFDGELSLTETSLLLHEAKLVHQPTDFKMLPPPPQLKLLK